MNILQALTMMRRSPRPIPTAAEDLARLRPAVIPAAWLDGSPWIPGFRLPAGDLALAWMLKRDLPTFVAVTRVAEWEAAGMAWQRQGFRNLREGDDAVLEEARDRAGRLEWLSLCHADGSGGARVLLQSQMAAHFPAGYRLAVPEPGTGFAVAADLAGERLAAARARVRDCCAGAETALSPELWIPEELAVPSSWLD